MIPNKTSMKNGFTIIEVLVAMVFFSIASMAILSLIQHSAGASQRVKHMSRAGRLAVTQSELIKGLSIDDPRLNQTEAPSIVLHNQLRVETTIRDNVPILKSPGAAGKKEIVSKLIEISVYMGKNETRLAVLTFIKTRSL